MLIRSTLRASQILNANFSTSAELGRGLLEKLNAWYSSLPETFRLPNWSKSVNGLAPYPTSIHFAYLLLVVYVYRAMLRPMARSSSPPLIFDLEDMSATSPLPANESMLDFMDLPEIESLPEIAISDEFGTGEATLHAAEKCASILVNFTRRLTSSDFTGFWYSCKLLMSLPCLSSNLMANLFRVTGRVCHNFKLPHAATGTGPKWGSCYPSKASRGLMVTCSALPKPKFSACQARPCPP